MTHQLSPIVPVTGTYILNNDQPSRHFIGSCSPFCSPNVAPSHREPHGREAPAVRVRAPAEIARAGPEMEKSVPGRRIPLDPLR